MEYYPIPLRFDKIMKGSQVENIDIRLSIHQNVRLMLKTFSLSYRFDPTFGCILNKYQAATPPQEGTKRAWKERMREDVQKSLKDLLQRYEKRIHMTDLLVDLSEPSKQSNNSVVKVKVQISGRLTLGRRELFHYPDNEIADEAKEVFPLVIPIGGR